MKPFLFLPVYFLAFAGCAQEGRTPDYPAVSGKVTLDGKPLEGAIVTFIPTGKTVGDNAVGATDAAGVYRLKGLRGNEGTPPGEYKVAISLWLLPNGTRPPAEGLAESGAMETLPPGYSDSLATKLKANVPEGGGTIDFALKKRP